MLVSDRGGVETGLGESLKQVGFHGSAVQPIGEFHHVALQVLGLDFVMSSQEKTLEIRQGDMHPRKQLMASFLISVQWSRDVLEALAAQSGVAGPTIGQDLATRFDLGFDKPLQAWGRGVLDDGQGRKSRNRFLPFFSWAAVLDRDGHHRLGFRSATLVFFSLGTPDIAFIHLDQPFQLVALIAIGHGLANLVLHQPGRRIRHSQFFTQLQGRDPLLVLAHPVQGPEPVLQRDPRLVKDRPGRDRSLIAALAALMNTSGFHIAPAVPAATRANEAAGPALAGQMLPALLLISKLLAKLFHR